MSFLSLRSSTSAGRPASRRCLVKSTVTARRLERERLEERTCCRAELVVLGVLAGLSLRGADEDVVARVVR
jgi:hypothetical protein